MTTKRPFEIYIAASWKHRHAVELLTAQLRERGYFVWSFVENQHGEMPGSKSGEKAVSFDDWVWSDDGRQSFEFDTNGATCTDLVLYISPSGKDAAAEVGAAWGRGIPVIGLHAKGEDFGLMRRMISWHQSWPEALKEIDQIAEIRGRKVK